MSICVIREASFFVSLWCVCIDGVCLFLSHVRDYSYISISRLSYYIILYSWRPGPGEKARKAAGLELALALATVCYTCRLILRNPRYTLWQRDNVVMVIGDSQMIPASQPSQTTQKSWDHIFTCYRTVIITVQYYNIHYNIHISLFMLLTGGRRCAGLTYRLVSA